MILSADYDRSGGGGGAYFAHKSREGLISHLTISSLLQTRFRSREHVSSATKDNRHYRDIGDAYQTRSGHLLGFQIKHAMAKKQLGDIIPALHQIAGPTTPPSRSFGEQDSSKWLRVYRPRAQDFSYRHSIDMQFINHS